MRNYAIFFNGMLRYSGNVVGRYKAAKIEKWRTEMEQVHFKEDEKFIDVETVVFLMKKNRLDVEALAEKVGVTSRTLKRFLSGGEQTNLKAEFLAKIAEALQTKIETLLTYDIKMLLQKNRK